MIKVAPSLLAADFRQLGEELKMVEAAGADMIHFDVMDGSYVPNISFGIPVLANIREETQLPFDVHLMIERPERHFKAFKDAGADIITFHAEATAHVHRAIQSIKEMGIKAGVALNPHTPISNIQHVLDIVDMVLLMSVNPGFGGQKLIPEVLEKGKDLRRMAQEKGVDFDLQIDGGITPDNAAMIASYGFNVLVAGTAVFKADDPADAIRRIKGV